jgi:4a-hydroxytetrahydrobiopterin dehydratase
MNDSTAALTERRCEACDPGTPPMGEDQIEAYLKELPDWTREGHAIQRAFEFKNYYRTMAFVNAVAWIAHCEGHHPDMTVSYNKCQVQLTTHAIGGLSENDFICAAKIDALRE